MSIPNTTTGLMHAMFGLTGTVLLSPGEFPSVPIAAVRANEALHSVQPAWLETDHGKVTPGQIREQLEANVAAVAVLLGDAIQGFGIVDAPRDLADVVVTGGQKWCRAGWGTGVMALSERALERLTPVFSGYTGTEDDEVWDEVPPPAAGARAYRVSNPDPIAQARFAAALEELAGAGVPEVNARVAGNVSRVIELADEFERAGIVVLEPEPEQVTVLSASLHNHGVTATTRLGTVRLSVHAVLSEDTVEMLRGAFVSFNTAATY